MNGRSVSMGIVIGSCMAKETSATSLSSPAVPSARSVNNNDDEDESSNSAVVVFNQQTDDSGQEIRISSTSNENRLHRILGSAYFHDGRRYSIRRVIHGESGVNYRAHIWHRILVPSIRPLRSFLFTLLKKRRESVYALQIASILFQRVQ